MVVRSQSMQKLPSGAGKSSPGKNTSGTVYRSGSQNARSPPSPASRQRQPSRSRSMSGLRSISPSKINGNGRVRVDHSPQRNRPVLVKSRNGNE